MSAEALRAAAYRRSVAREFVMSRLTEDQCATHDVGGIVTVLAACSDQDHETMDGETFAAIIAPHEYDANGLTDAALAKALQNSQTGWVAMVRRPDGDVQTFNMKKGVEGTTPETIEATLREFINFPEGTEIQVLPLVG